MHTYLGAAELFSLLETARKLSSTLKCFIEFTLKYNDVTQRPELDNHLLMLIYDVNIYSVHCSNRRGV